MRRALLALPLALLVCAAAPAAATSGRTLLRLDGIGPLRLGMSQTAALRTHWLVARRLGCDLASPRPVTYRLGGRAPGALRGTVEFVNGRLTDMSFSAGVRTATGVIVRGSTAGGMVHRYRAAGYRATSRYDSTFVGTFVTVSRRGRMLIQGFATHKLLETIAIPAIAVCE